MTYKSRMGELLRRQEAVRRARGRHVITAVVLLMLGASIAYTQVREFDALTAAVAAPLAGLSIWGAWRCTRVARSLTRLYTDAERIAAMASTDELPGLRDTLFRLREPGP